MGWDGMGGGESRADEGDSRGGNSRDVKGLSGLMTYCLKNHP